jgi:hypothetical protein
MKRRKRNEEKNGSDFDHLPDKFTDPSGTPKPAASDGKASCCKILPINGYLLSSVGEPKTRPSASLLFAFCNSLHARPMSPESQ